VFLMQSNGFSATAAWTRTPLFPGVEAEGQAVVFVDGALTAIAVDFTTSEILASTAPCLSVVTLGTTLTTPAIPMAMPFAGAIGSQLVFYGVRRKKVR
jgi:hypothetical protein